MKILNISPESFDFYQKMGLIKSLGRGKFEYDPKMDDMILEKGTVFKYHYNDTFVEESRDFINQVKHTGKVKKFTPEEIKTLEERMRGEGKLNVSKKKS